MSKRLAVVLVLLVALVAAAWSYRIELILFGVERLAAWNTPVGQTRDVTWSSGPDPAGRGQDERPPNVVLIVADDLGWNDLSFHGGGVAGGSVPTPHIDSIAREGVDFRQGYAANGTCAPSRATLMTGRYATRFGFEFTPTPAGMMPILGLLQGSRERNAPGRIDVEDVEVVPFDEMGMPPGEVTLAELLQRRDYQTVHIGKWHLGRAEGMAPLDQGFDESLLMVSALYARKDDPATVASRQEFDPIDRFLWRALQFAASHDGGPVFEPPRYLTDYYTDEAVEVIDANKDRPFFLYLAHFAPHNPLQATREDYEALAHIPLHRERVYAAMIRALDRGVGRVLAALEEHGLEENTLVIFTSDNGGAGYIGLPEVNAPFRGWKMTLFEGGIHVPLFARWPARLPAGRRYAEPVHHFDVFATIAAAAGAALPTDRRIDGVDLVPFVLGERAGPPHELLFWRSGAARSVRKGRYKLNVSAPPGLPRREWLIDLEADPSERRDLAPERPELLAELRAALDAHNAEQAEPLWASRVIAPINLDRDLSQPDQPEDEYAWWSN